MNINPHKFDPLSDIS